MKTLLHNAKIWLGKNDFTQAIGFDSVTEKIIFIGKDLDSDKKSFDVVINLEDKLVIPSFIEGHCHFVKGSLMKKELNLQNAATKEDFRKNILNFSQTIIKDEWIIGGYFSETNFIENFEVNTNLLDSICNDIPMFIFRTDLHSAVINSKAIEVSGIANKLNEFGSEIVIKDSNGNLTGEIKEKAYYYVMGQIPKKSQKGISEIIKDEIKCLHKFGINSITDITSPGDFDVYKFMLGNKYAFDLDLNCVLPFQEISRINYYKNILDDLFNEKSDNKFQKSHIYGNCKFRIGAFKAFYDGALSSKSAYFFDNYIGTDTNGLREDFVNSGEFESLGKIIDENNFQMLVHGIGDKAVSEILDFVEYLNGVNEKKDRRFRLEHSQHINNKDIKRFKELDVIASVQPSHLYVDAKVAKENLKDFSTTHVYKKLIEKGTPVCFGTDFPVASENPFETIYYAITREAKGFENGFIPELYLNIPQCLEAYTINNAYANFSENIYGSLKLGKLANLIVVKNDLFHINKSEIKDNEIFMNFYRGRQVY